jgi:DNA invertase Pin-like site-specific DNA recombinase
VVLQRSSDSGGQMVKCSQDQVKGLKKALQREKNPVARQRIQMILLREDGKTQPEIAELTGVSLSTVNRVHMAYDNGGADALRPKPTGVCFQIFLDGLGQEVFQVLYPADRGWCR